MFNFSNVLEKIKCKKVYNERIVHSNAVRDRNIIQEAEIQEAEIQGAKQYIRYDRTNEDINNLIIESGNIDGLIARNNLINSYETRMENTKLKDRKNRVFKLLDKVQDKIDYTKKHSTDNWLIEMENRLG